MVLTRGPFNCFIDFTIFKSTPDIALGFFPVFIWDVDAIRVTLDQHLANFGVLWFHSLQQTSDLVLFPLSNKLY